MAMNSVMFFIAYTNGGLCDSTLGSLMDSCGINIPMEQISNFNFITFMIYLVAGK